MTTLSRAPVPATADPPLSRPPRKVGALGVSSSLLAVAGGVLMVATAYAGGRDGSSWAEPLFFAGQLVLFLSVAALLVLPREIDVRAVVALLAGFAVATYLLRFAYSPLEFTFPDELSHWRTAQDVLATGQLFTPNPTLPVSPLFPGLELLTHALVSLTGLSLFAAGSLIVGTAHVLAVVTLVLLFHEIGGSPRVAGLGALIYATGPHFQSFDVMFLYTAPALPLAFLALLAAVRVLRPGPRQTRLVWLGLGVLAVTALVPTHHVTTAALVALLAALAAGALVTRNSGRAYLAAAMAAGSAALAALWVALAAPETIDYFRGPARDLVESLSGGGASAAAYTDPSPPAGERLLTYAAVAIVALALPFGWRVIRRRQGGDAAAVGFAIASAGYYGVLALRLGASDGAELASRALTFVLVPVAYVLAVLAVELLDRPRRLPGTGLTVMALSAIVFVGSALTAGWPPFWGRLPGPFLVEGFERGVSPQGVASAQWAADHLSRDNRVGGDTMSLVLMGTYGWQDPERKMAPLYYSDKLEPSDRTLVQQLGVQLLVVDRRMSQQLPAPGNYFPIDRLAGRLTRPIPARDLDKFATVPGISRLYDGGDILIYDLTGSWYAGS